MRTRTLTETSSAGSMPRHSSRNHGFAHGASSCEPLRSSGRKLLDGPAVAVRVVEEHELPPVELLDVTDLDTALDELSARLVDVGDDELALRRTRLLVGQTHAERDRAGGTRRRQLYEAQILAHRVVVVEREPRPLDVEVACAVDVRHGNRYQLELPVHQDVLLSVVGATSSTLPAAAGDGARMAQTDGMARMTVRHTSSTRAAATSVVSVPIAAAMGPATA